jgi:2-oxoglutarate ferredoxin oxidoreductase subunit alpha
METNSLSFIIAGNGGAGVITTGTMLLRAAARAGWYAYMTRSVGAQIRGGEAAAMLCISTQPVVCQEDHFHMMLAVDWQNMGKFAAEMPLSSESYLLGDSGQGEVPPELLRTGARSINLPLKEIAQTIPFGRPNMLILGIMAGLMDLPEEALRPILEEMIGGKGQRALDASLAAIQKGRELAASDLPKLPTLARPAAERGKRWIVTGNEATGMGAVRGGVRYVAAYPITPATEVLEWMAPALDKIGGTLVQVEDEPAAINHIIGASYGGVPSMTATSGPGLALMIESLGLSVASETPVVVVDVMRGGPSTGIPAKSEQSDLNIAIYGLHGDAPHLVLAPNSVTDCMITTQWAVHLAETLQAPALVLSDQSLGQTLAVVDRPEPVDFQTQRLLASSPPAGSKYHRYAITESGVSPMALPGTPGCQYTADGLEHATTGTPSSQASDHQSQMDKRLRKLTQYDYGDAWADLEGEGTTAVLTWGSCTGAVREAVRRLSADGRKVRVISLRLLFPLQPEKFAAALAGVERVLIVEQSHSGQFMRYLRAHYDLPKMKTFHRPGPLNMSPAEIVQQLIDWN